MFKSNLAVSRRLLFLQDCQGKGEGKGGNEGSYGAMRCLHLCLAIKLAIQQYCLANCNRGRRYCLFFIAGGTSEEWNVIRFFFFLIDRLKLLVFVSGAWLAAVHIAQRL